MHHPTEEHPAPEPPSEEAYGEASGAPLAPPSDELPAVEETESPETGEGPQLFDFETDARLGAEAPAPAPPEVDEPAPPEPEPEDEDDFDDLGPAQEDDYTADEPADRKRADETEDRPLPAETGEEDLLAEQPDFVDDPATDEEDLWFEKGPPKDFDFEDDR